MKQLIRFAAVLLAWSLQLAAADGARPGRWEKEIAAFEASDRAAPPPAGAVVFIGSSSFVRWTTLAADFPRVAVVNRGFGSQTNGVWLWGLGSSDERAPCFPSAARSCTPR